LDTTDRAAFAPAYRSGNQLGLPEDYRREPKLMYIMYRLDKAASFTLLNQKIEKGDADDG
jgi:hypothetical protein